MPRRDQTGPRGQGPQSGKRRGRRRCGTGIDQRSERGRRGKGRKDGSGQGQGRDMGQDR